MQTMIVINYLPRIYVVSFIARNVTDGHVLVGCNYELIGRTFYLNTCYGFLWGRACVTHTSHIHGTRYQLTLVFVCLY